MNRFHLIQHLLAHLTLLQAILYSLSTCAFGLAYSLSQSSPGLGLLLQVNPSGNSPPTWVTVGELMNIARGDVNEFDDVTNMQSLAREVIATITNPGKWSFECNRVSPDAGQIVLNTSFMNKTRLQYQITFPIARAAGQATVGDVVGFYAFLEKWVPDIKVEKAIRMMGSFQVTNLPTYVQGG